MPGSYSGQFKNLIEMKSAGVKWLFLLVMMVGAERASAQAVTREMALVNGVLHAMGGKDNYNNLRYVSWNFFGKRTLIWDKWKGNVRIDYNDGSLTIITSLHANKTQVVKNGVVITHPDSLQYYHAKGQQILLNDSYWLFMPFKLQDKGVHLKYIGKGETLDNQMSEVLQLTFDNVGLTPLNKYHVHIDPNTNLIVQWDYFVRADEETPTFTNSWTDYKWYGKILLSSGRGSFGNITDIKTYQSIPDRVFSDPTKPALPIR
jgi:hypothetical protein